ncbi:MAG: hypothetical protein KAQ99_07100 [Candidatus Aureabacteria bacterium]|nr:hypothetical protein [Candidatus Auribacterota bacterium]
MVIAAVTKWWDRLGDTTNLDKINEIIAAINANTSGLDGKLSTDPDYDSGFFAISVGATTTKTHSLGTTLCLIEVTGTGTWGGITNMGVGQRMAVVGSHPHERYGLVFKNLTTTTIQISRANEDYNINNSARIRMWKLV